MNRSLFKFAKAYAQKHQLAIDEHSERIDGVYGIVLVKTMQGGVTPNNIKFL